MAVQMFNVNFLSLYDMVRDKAEAVRYLQQLGILHSRRECTNGHEMPMSHEKSRAPGMQLKFEIKNISELIEVC